MKALLADTKNRTVTGQTTEVATKTRAPKTHQDHWKPRLKRRTYTDRNGTRVEIPEWQVRMFYQGREAWFNLETANQAAAAIKARDIYVSLVGKGWGETVAKYKPTPADKAEVCTVGEFLKDVRERSHLKPMTVRRYAVKLRKIVADLSKVDAGIKAEAKKAKYDYVTGGLKAWLAQLDSKRLDILTPESVNQWRNKYVAKAGNDPVARKSAERSAASYIRCARSLFASDVLAMLKVKLPSNPFEGVKLKDPGPQRYRSEVNPEWLMVSADADLKKEKTQQFLALVLCLWAGLRRKEADLLTWDQVDLVEGQIHIRRTPYFEPKTEESQRTVDLPDEVVLFLRSIKGKSDGEFVLDGSDANPSATFDYYRADSTWRALNAWLRGKGVRQQKAIHSLRKESGSWGASAYGIEAARHHLGHRDIRTTSAHYVAKRKRIEVGLSITGEALKAEGEK